MNIEEISINTKKDTINGNLSFLEAQSDIGFNIKRLYYIYDVPLGCIRGHHAHKKLMQMLFCPVGKVEIMFDNGDIKKIVIIDEPNRGVIIEPGVWHTLKFISSGTIVFVVASDYYDESDYVRNYDEFKKMIQSGFWKSREIAEE